MSLHRLQVTGIVRDANLGLNLKINSNNTFLKAQRQQKAGKVSVTTKEELEEHFTTN